MDELLISTGLSDFQHELWEIHCGQLHEVYVNGDTDKKRTKAKVHPVLTIWLINCLACTSISFYKEVQKVTKLSNTHHSQRETTKIQGLCELHRVIEVDKQDLQ
jgi:hypothetical protein